VHVWEGYSHTDSLLFIPDDEIKANFSLLSIKKSIKDKE